MGSLIKGAQDDKRGDSEGGDEEENEGPNAHVSLLDQHSELKKKAEGKCKSSVGNLRP